MDRGCHYFHVGPEGDCATFSQCALEMASGKVFQYRMRSCATNSKTFWSNSICIFAGFGWTCACHAIPITKVVFLAILCRDLWRVHVSQRKAIHGKLAGHTQQLEMTLCFIL